MSSRDQVVEAATAYLDSLVSHDPTGVPLHGDAWRRENGHDTGTGAEAIRDALRSEIMDVVKGYREVRWFVDGVEAVAFYLLEVEGGSEVLVAERFRVEDGLICEIEAVFDLSGQ